MKFIKEVLKGMLEAVGMLLTLAGVLFVAPIFAIAVGWVSGYFVELITGGYVTSGINMLFKTDLVQGDLPKVSAVIWLMSYVFGIRQLQNGNMTKRGRK